MRKYIKLLHYRSLHVIYFCSFVLPVFESCSAVWSSAVDSHLKLLNRVVKNASVSNGAMFEYNRAHRQSVLVLRMLLEITSNSMYLLGNASNILWVHCLCRVCRRMLLYRGALVSHKHSFVVPRCRTSQYRSIAGPLCPTQYL